MKRNDDGTWPMGTYDIATGSFTWAAMYLHDGWSVRRASWPSYAWVAPGGGLTLTHADILANDWQARRDRGRIIGGVQTEHTQASSY